MYDKIHRLLYITLVELVAVLLKRHHKTRRERKGERNHSLPELGTIHEVSTSYSNSDDADTKTIGRSNANLAK